MFSPTNIMMYRTGRERLARRRRIFWGFALSKDDFCSFLVPSAPTDKILHTARALLNVPRYFASVCNIWYHLGLPGFARQYIVPNIYSFVQKVRKSW